MKNSDPKLEPKKNLEPNCHSLIYSVLYILKLYSKPLPSLVNLSDKKTKQSVNVVI